jgi:hypothetical protein
VAKAVAIADLNGDSALDFVAVNCGPVGINTCGSETGVLGVALGDGHGSFGELVTYNSGGLAAHAIAIADVNADTTLDLLVANSCGNTSTCWPGSVGVLIGNGDGTFQPAVTYGTELDIASITTADVSGDAVLDVMVTSGGNNRVGVVQGNGDGTFQPIRLYDPAGIGTTSVGAVDLNGDGPLDLLVSNICNSVGCPTGSVGVLLGTGGGTFGPATGYDSGGTGARSIAAADLDGDSLSDVVVANQFYDSVGVLRGNGDGKLQSAATYPSGAAYATSLAVADVNGDSGLDLVVTNACLSSSNCPSGVVGVLLNRYVDRLPPHLRLSATPHTLWPPNGRSVDVVVVGSVSDAGSGVDPDAVTYAVDDEYGEIQTRGLVTLTPNGHFRFPVLLEASRFGTDLDGRTYIVTIRVVDNAGNSMTAAAHVTVPHDRRR